jgi:acyl-CoA synthetase (AMP-forming)/AMP-acid ligase II
MCQVSAMFHRIPARKQFDGNESTILNLPRNLIRASCIINLCRILFQLFDQEGFFKTGDLGYYDSQGVIHFIEKIENLIHFWMYEVSPNILESRLLGSNVIIDAAVVGIPNKENGEVITYCTFYQVRRNQHLV